MPATHPSNQALADQLHAIAQMLEVLGADRFRVIAHDRAARLVSDHASDLPALALSEGTAALTAIDGIGPKIADKVLEFARTGSITEHDQLRAQVPPGVLELLTIPGLGPKTARALWQTKGVQSVADLQRIIDDGSILHEPKVKGLGEKSVQNLNDAIAFAKASADRTPLGIAWTIAHSLAERIAAVQGVSRVEPAGSLRRGRETIGDLDLLAATTDPAAASHAFTTMPEVEKVLVAGETKASVRLAINGRALQADLRMVAPDAFGAALMYFTGSKEHNVRLRERALKMGYTLNEYGLFVEDKAKTPPHTRGVPPIASRTEEELFAALDLPFIPPELREDRAPDELARVVKGHRLIELRDIKAELHAHTTASDGRLSTEELALAAKARGFHTIAVTDHSQSSAIAGGLSPDALRRHIDAVREAASKLKGITLLAGSEVDILADGSLDYDDDLLAELDVVVASPHASLRQDPAVATARLLKAVRHPLVNILGHPTGRLVGEREGFFPDIGAIAAAAAENNVALEINANWRRLDLRDAHARAALDAGALIAIDCDVHRPEHFDNLKFGVMTARRAALDPARCVNTWTSAALRTWLRRGR